MISRRSFIRSTTLSTASMFVDRLPSYMNEFKVMTVRGPIPASNMDTTLIHEHILVDFIGAEKYDPARWNKEEVIKKVMPYLKELKATGCKTLIECTPNYLGRDVKLLQELSRLTGLNILTNTGYYGGSDNKFLPPQAFSETDVQLADRWIKESAEGIENTGIKPGFIKISVNNNSLSEISKKLIRAAGYCHLHTGLVIASHTGPAIPALEELEILKTLRVAPDAFIWVHAQSEKNWEHYLTAAKKGAWVSLDGLNEDNLSQYVDMLLYLKRENCLHRTLVSHDAGWYEPGKPMGGDFRGYTTLFLKLIPSLKQASFTDADIKQLLKNNPMKAFAITVRKA